MERLKMVDIGNKLETYTYIQKLLQCRNEGDEVESTEITEIEIEKDRRDGNIENAGCRK